MIGSRNREAVGDIMPRREVEPRLRGFAKSMRKAMTEPELHLWMHLRHQKLSGLKFRRQVPIGPFIVDFFCPTGRLIIELDGAQHYDDEAIAADLRRSSWLKSQGYRILSFTNLDVLTNVDGVCRSALPCAPSTKDIRVPASIPRLPNADLAQKYPWPFFVSGVLLTPNHSVA